MGAQPEGKPLIKGHLGACPDGRCNQDDGSHLLRPVGEHRGSRHGAAHGVAENIERNVRMSGFYKFYEGCEIIREQFSTAPPAPRLRVAETSLVIGIHTKPMSIEKTGAIPDEVGIIVQSMNPDDDNNQESH